jgi:hypothetical protein
MDLISSRLLWTLFALLFLALCVAVWIKMEPILNPDVAAVATSRPDCDLRAGPCEATFPDGGLVTLEISPAHIPTTQKLRLKVRTKGVDARQVEVDFAGADMNMGFNRVALSSDGPGEFTGTGMLPVCVRARMTWDARVLLHTKAGLMAAPFRFDTYLPGREPSARRAPAGSE